MDRSANLSAKVAAAAVRYLRLVRKAVGFRRPQLIVIARQLEGKSGHHFNELVGYSGAAHALRLSCQIIVPRSSASHLVAALRACPALEPLPRLADIDGQNILDKLIALFDAADNLEPLWTAIGSFNPVEEDLLLFTSADPILIAGAGIWLARRRPSQRPNVFFRLVGGELIDVQTGRLNPNADLFRIACSDLRTRAGHERVFLLASSPELMRIATRVCSRRVFPTSLPKHLAIMAKADRVLPATHTVYVHLNERSGRLIDGLGEIIRRVAAEESDTRFIIQLSGLTAERRAQLELELSSSAELLSQEQDTADYLANFCRCTAVLLAYEPRSYAALNSGVFIEAASFGKPVIAPAGTWMARQIAAGSGAGTLFEELNPESVAAALLEVLRNADKFNAAAGAVASRVRTENSSLRFVEEMLRLARTRLDMEPRYRLGEEIDFSDWYDSRCFIREGWGHTEEWGIWTIARHARLCFKLESERPLLLRALVRSFLTPTHRRIMVRVAVAGREVACWMFNLDDPDADQSHWREASIPNQGPKYSNGSLDLSFAIETPASPHGEGISADRRSLGLGLCKLCFSASSEAAEAAKRPPGQREAGNGKTL